MARAQSMNRFVDDDDYDEDALKQLNYIKDNWNKSSSQNSSINSSNNSSRNTSQEVVCTSADEVDDARVRTRSRRAKSSDKSTLEWNYTEFHMHKDGAINLKKMSLKKTPISAEDTNIGYPTKKQAKIPNDPGTKSRSTSKRSFLLIASSIVIVLSIVAWYSYNKQSYEDLEMEGNRKRCHVSRLESQFPNQRKQIWTALKFGIETTINDDPTRPSIYLFVYNDPNTVSRFMSAVTQLTRNCMEAWVDPLVLGRDQLSSSEMQNDYGVALEKYKPELSNSGVLLVNDIDRVSIIKMDVRLLDLTDAVLQINSSLYIYIL